MSNTTYPRLRVIYIASVIRQRIGTPAYDGSLQRILQQSGHCESIDCQECIFGLGDLSCAAHVGFHNTRHIIYSPAEMRRYVLRIL